MIPIHGCVESLARRGQTARRLGLAIPQMLRLSANEVIE